MKDDYTWHAVARDPHTIHKTITVTDGQDRWIKDRVIDGGFPDDSEYVRALIRRDQMECAQLPRLQSPIT